MRGMAVMAAAAGLSMALACGTAQAQTQTVQLTYTQPLASQSVQMVQQRLQQLGEYSGNIDGQWGPDSVIALQRFQEQHGIQPTGQLNESTVASLGMNPAMLLGEPAQTTAAAPAYAAPGYPPPGAVNPRGIAAVQGRLRDLGYYHGGLDGVWGPDTQQALAQFQQRNGLQPNAELNPATITALGLNPGWVYAGR